MNTTSPSIATLFPKNALLLAGPFIFAVSVHTSFVLLKIYTLPLLILEPVSSAHAPTIAKSPSIAKL